MTEIPEWMATLVGRLILENEALRRALAEVQPPQPTTDGQVHAGSPDGPLVSHQTAPA